MTTATWLELDPQRPFHLGGWMAAGLLVAGFSAGLTLLAAPALRPEPQGFAVILAAPLPPAAPPLTAMSEPAPDPVEAPQPVVAPKPETLTLPDTPRVDTTPLPLDMPALALGTLPDSAPKAPAPVEEPKPQKMAEAPVETPPVEKPKKKPKPAQKPKAEAAPAPQPEAAAPTVAAKASGSGSPKAWAQSVVKQIRKTAKARSPGKGVVQVGFTVGKDGSLTQVSVLQSSGDAAVDAMGLDHIRRAAPFPPPPEGANRNLAFAFELR